MCLFSFVSIVVYFFFYAFWNVLNVHIRNIGVVISFTQVVSYVSTFLKNPGLPTKELWLQNIKDSDVNDYTICNRCKIIMPKDMNIEHCEDCDVCVVGMDHHCPWTSKCVGEGNLWLFYVFVISTFVLLLYFMVALVLLAFTQE